MTENNELIKMLEELDKQIVNDFCEIIKEYGLEGLNKLLKDKGYKIEKL